MKPPLTHINKWHFVLPWVRAETKDPAIDQMIHNGTTHKFTCICALNHDELGKKVNGLTIYSVCLWKNVYLFHWCAGCLLKHGDVVFYGIISFPTWIYSCISVHVAHSATLLCVWELTYAVSIRPIIRMRVCLCISLSNGGQVLITGGWTSACFRAAPCQHGDLGAEGVAAAGHGRVLVFGVGAHVSLQVPPPPLPLDLRLDLRYIMRNRLKVRISGNFMEPNFCCWPINHKEDLSRDRFVKALQLAVPNYMERGGQCVHGTIPWCIRSDAFYIKQEKN